MARRRLNKKVALIGSTVFLLLVLIAVVLILRLNRDPAPFIVDGDAAWAVRDYEAARQNYSTAFGLAGSPEAQRTLLFKLADVYRELNQWDRVLGCWERVITSDPEDVRARLGQLKYSYILTDSLGDAGPGMNRYWEDVLFRVSKTLDVVTRADLLNEDTAAWEPSFGAVRERGWSRGPARLGPRLYLIKGRAELELAALGAVTSPDNVLRQAETDLREAGRLDPSHPQAYHYLARVSLERGRIAASRGSLNEKSAGEQQAIDLLTEGIRAAGDAAEAHVHALAQTLNMAQANSVAAARDQMKSLEPRYEDLLQRFASDPQVFLAAAQFYALYAAYLDSSQAPEKLDRAIEFAERAASLDADSADPPIFAAGCHYRRFSAHGDTPALLKAIELTEKALRLPDAQDTPGPTQIARRFNRFSLCSLLAKCCVERILMLPQSDAARAELLARAEQAVHEIGQIQGSGENPDVLKWRGMLDLARGDADKAIRILHAAYEQIKATNPPEQRDAFLAYMLAKVFKETAETGAVIDFLATALGSGIAQTRPDAILDYGNVLLEVGSYDAALSAVNTFEERFGPNGMSRTLGTKALIAKGHVTEAEQRIARLDPSDPNTIMLNLHLVRAKSGQLQTAIRRQEPGPESPIGLQPTGAEGQARSEDDIRVMQAELRTYHRQQGDLVRRLLQVDPDVVLEGYVAGLCESLVQQGDAAVAGAVVNAFLGYSPNSATGLFYRGLLAEPDPPNCPPSRRKEIQEQAIRAIGDPVRRALELGRFHEQNEQYDGAVSQWRAVLDATASQGVQKTPAYLKAGQLSPRHVAAGNLFDLARHRQNWQLAGEIVALAKRENLDDCGGYLYAARLAFAKTEYTAALSHLEECLRQRPVFSYGYMLRGNVKAQLGREQESVADVRRAADLNPADPLIAKALANALYQRNNRLGNALSAEQTDEVVRALERAAHLNPRDTNLLSVYADTLSESEPFKALAIRQTIQAAVPSPNNAVMLGRLATRVGLKETDSARREMLFTVAQTAFEQARQTDPTSQVVLDSYAEYLRARGQNDRARQLLADSNDKRLLWRHYFRIGRYDEAKKLLDEMYAQSGDRIDALKGLILVGEQTSDREGVKRYSGELLSLEDNAVNRLAQLRAYLEVGMAGEAEWRLQSFKEKYPNDPRILLMEALVAKCQGQLDRALELTNRNLERNQQSAAAWRLRGEVHFLMGDHDRAILDFCKSAILEDDPITAIGLAKAYLWAGRDDDAISELRRVLNRPGTPVQARLLLEGIYLRLGRQESLKQLYEDTLTESSDDVYWLSRAGAFAVSQREYDRAEELYARAYHMKRQRAGVPAAETTRDSQYVATLDQYLRVLILAAGDRAVSGETWRPDKLERVFEEGGKHTDTPYAAVVLCRMAEARQKLGDMNAARDYCCRAVDKAWGNDQLAAEVLLRVHQVLGGEEVRRFCQERLATEPDSPAANFTMFNLAKTEGRHDEADGYIDKCIRLAGPDTDRGLEYTIRKAELLTVAHKATADKRYLEGAVGVYESLRVKMPKNSSVLNNLAYMLAQNEQRLAEALEYAKAAVEQAPDEATYRDTYAYVLYKNGKYAQAAQVLAAAIQQYEARATTAPAEVYEHLGMIHEALGERNKARAAYRRALDIGGDALPAVARDRIGLAILRLGQ